MSVMTSCPFFEGYDQQRICIDRVVIVIYDKKYALDKHPFDQDLARLYINHIKRSKIGRGRSEEVIESANKHSSYEMRLKGSRSMLCHYNVIRAYKSINGIRNESSSIINEDNFFPLGMNIPIEDQLKVLYSAIEELKIIYHDQVLKWWDYDCQNIEATIKAIEIPFEIQPENVSNIFEQLSIQGKNVYRYTTQSGTMYFQEKQELSEKKYNEYLNSPANNESSSMSMVSNNFNSGFDTRVQLKIYQKSWGLVRIEHTLYGEDIKLIFHLSEHTISEDAEHLCMFLEGQFQRRGLYFKREVISYNQALFCYSRSTGVEVSVLDRLSKIDRWESSRENKHTTKKLLDKGLITKSGRGLYFPDKTFRKMINLFEEIETLTPAALP